MNYKLPMDQQKKTSKTSVMHRVVRVLQKAARRSYRRARRLFCGSLDALLRRPLFLCPAPNSQQTQEKPAQVALRSAPSTILIVNISNSNLIHCVIGNETYSSAATDSQPLMKEPEPDISDHTCCCNSHGQEGAADTSPPVPPPPLYSQPPAHPRNINIQGSSLRCVIIGDGNYMHSEQMYEDETS